MSIGAAHPPTTRPPAMTDVARVAGVSHQTVSRVLNNHVHVAAATRDRVRAAIDQLGYRPNTAARALVTGRSGIIGVVSTGSTLHGPVSTLWAVEVAAREAGYTVTVLNAPSIDRGAIDEAVTRLAGQGVDGVVVIAPFEASTDGLAALARKLPLVVAEGSPAGALAVVAVDQVEGARLATQHLLDLGHHSVVHVAGQNGWYETAGRVDGWRAALLSARVVAPAVLAGDWTAASGYRSGQVLATDPRTTAVFAANDAMALGVLHALRDAGRRVPHDVSVIGFDDVPDAAHYSPPLTTVRQDFAAVGRESLRALLELVHTGIDQQERHIIAPQLVLRASTAGPPRGGGRS